MKSETTQFATNHQTASGRQLGDLASYKAVYADGIDPIQVLTALYSQIDQSIHSSVWISLLPLETALEMLSDARRRKDRGDVLPLFGIPFAVKDNIDVMGLPTTAGCPEFSYMPERHAFVVQKLVAAGAIPIGKTNLDQFATGLNGTRTSHGIPRCVFNEKYVSGGSSSGSAVAVASGLVPFSLGTDTAGSGRVPAAFNNLVGLKPTKGLFSNTGVVPAVRSQDCISVFAHHIDDALVVSRIAAAYDAEDAYSRLAPVTCLSEKNWPARFSFGVPAKEQLEFFGDEEAEAIFNAAIRRLEEMGGTCIRFDYTPFKQAAELLYAGPWIAERLAAIETFAGAHADAINPVVREIVFSARGMSAVDTFKASYRLANLTRIAEGTWNQIDVMLLPTAPTIYTVEEMLADPVRLNSNLGLYTNFVNLMDLSAVAVPAGFRTDGLPFGVTLIGRAFEDGTIASLGKAFIQQAEVRTSANNRPHPKEATVPIAVVGAHLSGQPLNHQLKDRNGTLKATMRTAHGYALYALSGTTPAKPGMIRDDTAAGKIEVEIWELPVAGFGSFVNEIPAPLGIGTITLEDGSLVKGFLCEPYALQGAVDITHFGGWRAYKAAQAA